MNAGDIWARWVGALAIAVLPSLSFAGETTEPNFLDQVLEDQTPQSAKNRSLRPLNNAWERLAKGLPIDGGKIVMTPPEWRDHVLAVEGFGLQAKAESLLAGQNVKPSKIDEALRLAAKASGVWIQIHQEFPDSPYERRHEEYLAESDLLTGHGLSKKQRHAQALDAFHRGMVRLSGVQLPLRMHRERILAFAFSCQKALTPACAHWTLRLARAFPDGSVEKKLIVEKMPYLSEIPTPEYGYRYNPLNYKSPDQDQKAFDEAFSFVLVRKYSDAIEKFEALLRDYPRTAHRIRVQFWLGRLHGLQGNEDQFKSMMRDLLAESPLTYYGLLAALSLGLTPDGAIDAQLPRALRSDAFLTPTERSRLERVASMGAWKQSTPAWYALDLKDFKSRAALSSPFLMYVAAVASRAGRHLTAFQLIGDLIQRGYPGVTSSAVLRMIFPMPFSDYIQSVADEEKVDPLLVTSLTKQESAFDSEAFSSSGALGLMQLMPFTAVEVDPQVEQRAILDPKTNLKLGTRYLGLLLRKFNGNAVYALAGYNAGPHRVRSWRREAAKDGNPESDMLEFIETIPFTETRGYVSSIMRNYFWYNYLTTGKALKSLTFFWAPALAPSPEPEPTPVKPQT